MVAKKCAFTLAEVLITLVIIGVVAALTIPNLYTKYDKHQTAVQLKKVYSIMHQAVHMSVNDNGPISEWDTTLSEADFAEKYFKPYLKLGENNAKLISYKNINPKRNGRAIKAALVLSDGTYISFYCPQGKGIVVDINGAKGPNRSGRDLFAFSFKGNTITTYNQYPTLMVRPWINSAGTSGQCNVNATGGFLLGGGDYCSNMIEQDSWEIKDDYPW